MEKKEFNTHRDVVDSSSDLIDLLVDSIDDLGMPIPTDDREVEYILSEFEEEGIGLYESVSKENEKENEMELKRLTEVRNDMRDAVSEFMSASDDWSYANFNKLGYNQEGDFDKQKFVRYMKVVAQETGRKIPKGTFGIPGPKRKDYDDFLESPDSEKAEVPVSEELAELIRLCDGAIEKVNSVENRVKQKFSLVYDTIYQVALGKTDKDFAIIAGDSGIGKCLGKETKIRIMVLNDIAKLIQSLYGCEYDEKTFELTIEIGQFFDFIEKKCKLVLPDDELVAAPFAIAIKDENNKWVKCPKIIKKQAPLYETIFSDNRVLRAADKHILEIIPERAIGTFVECLVSGFEIPYLGISVISNKKISDNETVYGLQVDSDTHLYKTADGLIHHNTHTAQLALSDAEPVLTKKGWAIKATYGSIGNSLTSLAVFLFNHRQNYVLIMDDADGFLLSGNAQVQNILKAALEQHPVTFPNTVLDRLNRERGAIEAQNESTIEKSVIDKIQLLNGFINRKRLREEIEGYGYESEDDREEEDREESDYSYNYKINTKPSNENISSNVSTERNNDTKDDDNDDENKEELDKFLALKSGGIPDSFLFESKMIFISNLRFSQLNEAVLSRMDNYEIVLTPEEFLYRVKSVLPAIVVKGDFTDEEKEWAKQKSLGLLGLAIEAQEKDKMLFGGSVAIQKSQLQFRLIPTLTTKLLNYVNKEMDSLRINDKNEAFKSVLPDYVRFVLLPRLRGVSRT
jgi:hypothetical protein